MRLRDLRPMGLLLASVALITCVGGAHASEGVALPPLRSLVPHLKEKTLLRELVGYDSYDRMISGQAEMEDYGLIEINLKSKAIKETDVQALIKYLETLPVPPDKSGDFFLSLIARLHFIYDHNFVQLSGMLHNWHQWGDVSHWTEDNKRAALRELKFAKNYLEKIKTKYGKLPSFSPMITKKEDELQKLQESILSSRSRSVSPDSAVGSMQESRSHSPLLSHEDDFEEKLAELKNQVRAEIKRVYGTDREQLQEELDNMDIIGGGQSLDEDMSQEVADAQKMAHYETLLNHYKGMKPHSASTPNRDLDEDLPALMGHHSPIKSLSHESVVSEATPMMPMDEEDSPSEATPMMPMDEEDSPSEATPMMPMGEEDSSSEASIPSSSDEEEWYSDEAFDERQKERDLKARKRDARVEVIPQEISGEIESVPQKQLSTPTQEPRGNHLSDEDTRLIHESHESISQHVKDLNKALVALQEGSVFKGLRKGKQKEILNIIEKIMNGEHKNQGTHQLMVLQKDSGTHNLHESKINLLGEMNAGVQALEQAVVKSKNQQLTKAMNPVLKAMHDLKKSMAIHQETLKAARGSQEGLDLSYDHERGQTLRDE